MQYLKLPKGNYIFDDPGATVREVKISMVDETRLGMRKNP